MTNMHVKIKQAKLLYEAVNNQDIDYIKKNFVSFDEYFDCEALRKCVLLGNVEILALLIKRGACIKGSNFMELAAAFEQMPMCEFLRLQGEDVNKLIGYKGGYNISSKFEDWARAIKEKTQISKELESVFCQKSNLPLKI